MHNSNLDNRDRAIATAIVACNIVIINVLFFVMVTLWKNDEMLLNRCLLLNICYILSIPLSGVALAQRKLRPDQVVATSLKGTIYFVSIWCIMGSFSKFLISTPQFYTYYFAIAAILMIGCRVAAHKCINRFRNSGRNLCHVVFIGATTSMIELYQEMSPDVNAGFKINGYFDTTPSDRYPKECRYLGSIDNLPNHIQNSCVHRIYCGILTEQPNSIKSIIELCDSHLIRFFSVPNLGAHLLSQRVSLELFSDIPILTIRQEPLSRVENRVIKRLFDIIFSLIFLVVAFPIITLIFGVIIKLSSKGPIFFKQKRNGIDGSEFLCYKFRSMRINIDADRVQATENDPRKTKIGDFMRRTNIDELPQFINVFWGDMSVVGPRPHMLKHTEEYSKLINEYMVRHLIKPGVTGWAQINGYRGETKTLDQMAKRIKADIWYMEHWNFMLDLYIIYKTILTIFIRDEKAF
ncbi:MAG: undecaprenyl-phosphate glucose phosphotransferase [Rikenellaceae bacterium]